MKLKNSHLNSIKLIGFFNYFLQKYHKKLNSTSFDMEITSST